MKTLFFTLIFAISVSLNAHANSYISYNDYQSSISDKWQIDCDIDTFSKMNQNLNLPNSNEEFITEVKDYISTFTYKQIQRIHEINPDGAEIIIDNLKKRNLVLLCEESIEELMKGKDVLISDITSNPEDILFEIAGVHISNDDGSSGKILSPGLFDVIFNQEESSDILMRNYQNIFIHEFLHHAKFETKTPKEHNLVESEHKKLLNEDSVYSCLNYLFPPSLDPKILNMRKYDWAKDLLAYNSCVTCAKTVAQGIPFKYFFIKDKNMLYDSGQIPNFKISKRSNDQALAELRCEQAIQKQLVFNHGWDVSDLPLNE